MTGSTRPHKQECGGDQGDTSRTLETKGGRIPQKPSCWWERYQEAYPPSTCTPNKVTNLSQQAEGAGR